MTRRGPLFLVTLSEGRERDRAPLGQRLNLDDNIIPSFEVPPKKERERKGEALN